MQTLTWNELAERYCETQQCEPAELLDRLHQVAANLNPDGFMLLECEMLDSSFLGQRTVLAYGPNCTFREPPAHPIVLYGLASRTSTVIGILPIDALP